MRHHYFNWVEDQEFGNMGWLEEGAPNHFNAGDGRLVAHDLLEHLGPRLPNTNEDELRALGAVVFVRGLPGYFYQQNTFNPDWKYHLAADICQEFHNIISNWQDNPAFEPPSTRRLADDELDDELKELVEAAAKSYREEFYALKKPSKRVKSQVLSCLRLGYRAARKKYCNDFYRPLNLFMDIEREVNRLSKFADFGHRLRVSINIKNFNSEVKLEDGGYEWQ